MEERHSSSRGRPLDTDDEPSGYKPESGGVLSELELVDAEEGEA